MPTLDRRNAAALFIAAAVALASGPAGAETLLPAAKAFPFLKEYLALTPNARDRFAPIYVLHAKAGSWVGAQAWLVKDGRRTPLPIGSDGQLSPPARGDLEDGQITFTFPPGAKIGLRVEVVASLPQRAEVQTATLEASLAQANGAMHAGLPFIGPPRMTRLEFPGSEDAELVSVADQHSPLPRTEGVAYYEPSPAARGGVIRFRRPPSRIVLTSGR